MFAECQVLLGKLDCIMPLKKKNKIKIWPTNPNQKIHVIHVLLPSKNCHSFSEADGGIAKMLTSIGGFWKQK